ncbi:universal stress protein [Methanobrevibacter wolinii]|uniref:universal stress protein n=1 Tax=Methanobrevibacter wolinii TaxID=190977 RepID=UPI000AAA0371|nr:universal stress protein [Methanobrevibacter wolinii]
MMYKKIIVPTDGSKNSEREIEKAINLLEPNGELVIVSVAVKVKAHSLQRQVDLNGINKSLKEEATEKANAFASKIDSSVNVSVKVSSGNPADEIVKIADKVDADLIVIASAGETGIQKFLIGSVATKVLKTSNVDVLLVEN